MLEIGQAGKSVRKKKRRLAFKSAVAKAMRAHVRSRKESEAKKDAEAFLRFAYRVRPIF